MNKDLDLTFDFSDMANEEVETKQKEKEIQQTTDEDKEEESSILFPIDEEDITLPEGLEKEIIDDVKEDNIEYAWELSLDEQEEEQNKELDVNSIEIEEEGITTDEQEDVKIEDEQITQEPTEDREFDINSFEIEEEEEPTISDKSKEFDENLEKHATNEESERDFTIESFELEEEGEPIVSDEVQEFEEYLEEKANNEEAPIISEEAKEFEEYMEKKLANEEEPPISEGVKELDEYLEEKSTNEDSKIEIDEEEAVEPLEENINEEEQLTQDENLEVDINEEVNQIEEVNNPQEELSDEWENQSIDLEEEPLQEFEEIQEKPIIQSNSEEEIIPEEETQKQEEIVVNEPQEIEENVEPQEIDVNPYTPKKILSPQEREEKMNQEILDEFEYEEPQKEDFYEEPIEETKQEERIENEVEENFEPISIETPVEMEEDIDMNLWQIEKVELWTQEPISKKSKFQFKKSYLIGIVAVVVLGIAWYFLKDILMPSQPTPQPSENQTNNENSTSEENEGAEKDEGVDEEQEEAKNKLLLEQKEKMEKAFPFYKVVSLSNTTFLDYLWENFNNVVSEKFEKIIDPQVREATVFLYQYKPQKLSNKKLVSLLKKSVKWDKVAFKLIANIYWKLNKKVVWVEKKLKTDKGVKALNKLLIEQLNTNVPFVTSVNKELENIANKSNNRLALFVYKNRIKDLRQTIVETKPSIQEVLSDDDYVYFEKWLSLPETKNYNIKQEQKMTEILLWALLQNERIVSVLKKTPDKIAKELDNSTVLRDAIDLTYKIDFYHKYLSDMLKINLEEN